MKRTNSPFSNSHQSQFLSHSSPVFSALSHPSLFFFISPISHKKASLSQNFYAPSKTKNNRALFSSTREGMKSSAYINNHSEIEKKISFSLYKNIQVRSFHYSKRNLVNVYSEIKYLLNNNPINKETQLKIERFLFKHGLNDFSEDKQISGIYSGLYSKKVTEFLIKFHPLIRKKITEFIKFKKHFEDENKPKSQYKLYLVDIIEVVGIPFIITVLLGRFIKILSNSRYNLTYEKNLVLDVSIDLSKDLIRQYFYLKYENHHKKLIEKGDLNMTDKYTYSHWRDENLELFSRFEDDIIKVNIGVLLIEWLEDCNLLTKKLVKLNTHQHNIYSSSEQLVEEWDNKVNSNVWVASEESKSLLEIKNIPIISPMRLPSIIKPKPYTFSDDGKKVFLGGYLLNDIEYADDLILKNHSLDKESIIHNKNIIYDVVNKLNSVGYKINTETLNFINMNPNFYDDSLVSNHHPLDIKTKLTKSEKLILQKHISILEFQTHILNIADLLSNIPEFFFINRIDNRGRLYCITEYLNYQSSELAKSLLLFSTPNKIHRVDNEIAILYFKSYGANCFGGKLRKASLNDKAAWVDSNSEIILSFENGDIIKQAENKFLFTSFCTEYKRWLNFLYNSEDPFFNTYLPIQLDASCNGFQHLVLLSSETTIREQLNLTSTNYSKKPQDFYSYILEVYKDYLSSLDFTNLKSEEKDSYERIQNFCLDRKLIKKMIMTIPYNASTRKMVDDITEFLIKKNEKSGDNELLYWYHPQDTYNSSKKLSYKDLYLLVSSMKNILDNVAPKIARLKFYLEKIAYVCTKLELHIPWLLPNGLEVRQSYLKEKSVDLKPFTYSNTKLRLSIFSRKLDLDKQIRAFMPNLIHSLDATSLMLLLNGYFNNNEFNVKNIYTVHDCFAMTMNHVEFIIDNLRKVYISIYSDDKYLEQLDKYILNNIQCHYRNVKLDKENNTLTVIQDEQTKKFFYPNVNEVLGKDFPSIDYNTHYLLV